jgi:hypothetical protein
MIDIKNEDNVLIHPLIHDSEINGLDFGNRKSKLFTIHCVSTSGVLFDLKIYGVEHLYCGNFQVQNVIFNIQCYDGQIPSEFDSTVQKAFEVNDGLYAQLKTRIADDGLVFLNIFPSVGCEVFVVAKNIELSIKN